MKNNLEHPETNFWFGFAFGVIATGGISFLLGTKKGRQLLKQILELSENIEEDITPLVKIINEKFGKKSEEIKAEVENLLNDIQSKRTENKTGHSLGSIIQKMKFLS